MRKMGKRVLAFVCMIALLLSSTNMLSIVQANTNSKKSSDGFTDITVTDMGMEKSNTYNTTGDLAFWNSLSNGETLDKKTFRAYVTFPERDTAFIYGGNSDTWGGLWIRPNGENGEIVMMANVIGTGSISFAPKAGQSFVNQRVLLTVSAEVRGSDVVITAAVDDSEEQTMTITGAAASFGKQILGYCPSVGGLKLEEYRKTEAFEKITVTDMGMEESNTYNTIGDLAFWNSLSNGETLDKKTFRAYVTFPEAAAAIIYGGNSDTWGGLWIRPNGDNGEIVMQAIVIGSGSISFAPKEGQSFVNQRTLITVSAEVRGSDVVITASVDDSAEQTMTIAGAAASFGKQLLGFCPSVGGLKMEACQDKETAPDTLPQVGWSDFGVTEDTVYATNNDMQRLPAELDQTNMSFRGKVKFERTNDTNEPMISFGENNWAGLRVVATQADSLQLLGLNADYSVGLNQTITKADAEITSFVNQEYELGLDIWKDGTNIKMLVFINGKQINNTAYVWENGAAVFTTHASIFTGTESSVTLLVGGGQTPADLTSIDWKTFGITGNKTCATGSGDIAALHANEVSQIDVSFRGKVKFNRAADSDLLMLAFGSTGWDGLRVMQTGDDKLTIQGVGGTNPVLAEITPQQAGITSFANQEFELGLDIWSENGADLKVNVFVNGVQMTETAGIWEGAVSNGYMKKGMYGIAQNSSSISLIVEEETQPVELTSIDWKSFGITADKTCRATDDAKIISENPVSTLSGTSFRGNVTFHRASAEDTLMLSVGCSVNGWDGLRIVQSDDALSLFGVQLNGVGVDFAATITKEMAQVDSFSNQEFELGLDIWTTNQTDYKIDVYVNGHKATESPIIWANAVTNGYLQNNLAYFANGTSMIEMLLHEAPDVVPDDLERVTWEELKIDEDDYGYTTGGFSKSGTYEKASLRNVSFRGSMKFIGTGAEMTFGDNRDGWQLGLNFIPQEDGTLRVWNRSDNSDDKIDVILDPAQVGLESFVDTKFELGVDAWADGKNLKYIVYINGIRYNEKAYIWKGGAASELCYDYLTIGLLVRDRSSQIAILYPEVEKEASPEGLKKITWADFTLGNQKYSLADTADRSGLLVKSNNDVSDLLNTSFSGKVKFNKLEEGGNLLISYGANGWNWDGIRIGITEEGKLRFQGIDLANASYPVIADVTTKKAGVESFNAQTITLGIDIWKSGNDAKINIFVNGIQCTTKAYVWKDAAKNKCLGNGMNLIVEKEKDSLVLESIISISGNTVKPDAALKEISFSSFGITDGVYASKHPDFAVQGGFFDPAIGKSLNGTLLNVDLRFAGESVEFRYGGMDNAWEGLVLRSSGKHLLLVDTSGLLAEFVPEFAGTELTNKKINLKISLNYVDSDHDGAKDDVKLGFWFNNVLYRNQFIYLKDYAGKLGSKLGVYIPEGSGTLAVTSAAVDNSIDFALFGFTKNFKQYLSSTGIAKEIRTKL